MAVPKPKKAIHEFNDGTNVPERFLKDEYSGPISCKNCRWEGDFSSLNMTGVCDSTFKQERRSRKYVDAMCPLCSSSEFTYDPEYHLDYAPIPMMIHPGVYLPYGDGELPW